MVMGMSDGNDGGDNGGGGPSDTPSFDGELITNAEGSDSSDTDGSESSGDDSD